MRAAVALLLLALVAPPALAHEDGDDCGSGGDAPFSVHKGAIVTAPVDCIAHFGGSADERDSFRFEVPAGVHVRVEVIPLVAGHFPNLGLYSPDHNHNGESIFWDRNNASERHVHADVVEPGLWGVYLYLQESVSSGRLVDADYRLVITVEGQAWAPDAHEGEIAVGTPIGSRVGRALGPEGPAELDGLDGDWIALAHVTTGADFLRVSSPDCDACLSVTYKLVSGSVFDAGCQRGDGALHCAPFAGVTHVLVQASQGLDVRFTALHWHAPAE